jgi:predicted sulfurtransferase
MFEKRLMLLLLLAVAIVVTGMGQRPKGVDAPRMSAEELKGRLGSPDVVVIDVRVVGDWKESDRMIAGAHREDPDEVEKWAGGYPKGKTIVLYCA